MKEEGGVQLVEKNISTEAYKASLNEEELLKFNENVNHLIFHDFVYNALKKPNIHRNTIIIYMTQKKVEKDDKMED